MTVVDRICDNRKGVIMKFIAKVFVLGSNDVF